MNKICRQCVYHLSVTGWCTEHDTPVADDDYCGRFIPTEGHRIDDFRPMMTVRITDEPEPAPVEEEEDPLLDQVAAMYNAGESWKGMREKLRIGFKRQKAIVDRAHELGMIKELRGNTWGLRRGPVKVQSEDKKKNEVKVKDGTVLLKHLPAFDDDELRALYAGIEREMGRRVLREA